EFGKTTVTATMQNVRLFTALKVLADMADLQPVVIGNVYYVTGRANAERLEVKEWPQPEPAEPVIPPAGPAQPPVPKKDTQAPDGPNSYSGASSPYSTRKAPGRREEKLGAAPGRCSGPAAAPDCGRRCGKARDEWPAQHGRTSAT